MEIDVGIIGAGIVGLTTAVRMKERYPEKSVHLFERHAHPFAEASGNNSGVIHSGIHQKAGFLKSKLARIGGPKLVDFCERNNVPIVKRGMIIAAAQGDLARLIGEARSLTLLFRNSRRADIPLHFLSGRRIREFEPNVRAAFGFYLPDIYVVDQPALGKALESRATALGAVIHYQAGLRDIMCSGDTFTLMTEIGVCRARTVVNAAGVASADISADAGFPGYRIYPYVGEYCEIIPEKENLIREKLIYPALPPGSPTKGIHFLKTVSGKLFIGPNAKPLGKESKTEAEREATKLEMLASAQKFLPMLRAEDLRFSHSGVRAKTNPGIGEDDFVLRVECHNPTFVNALGIESPGVAASPEIADYLVDLCFGN